MNRPLELLDFVKLDEPYKGKFEYGLLDGGPSKDDCWHVHIVGSDESIVLPAEKLTWMPPFRMTIDFLGKLLRYEITYEEYAQHAIPAENSKFDDPYSYTLEDAEAMVQNLIQKSPNEESLNPWLRMIAEELFDAFECAEDPKTEAKRTCMGVAYPKNDACMALYIVRAVCDTVNCSTDLLSTLPLVLEDIQNYRRKKPLHLYNWSTANQLSALKNLDTQKLRRLSPDEKTALKEILEALYAKDYPQAIEEMGYCFYGGNELYPCDWEKSRDCFLRLMDMEKVDDLLKCRYANTLGYIYYYGRCNCGIPEYDKAYYYFSIGSAGGFYESTYKLADMYMRGYYVPKNKRAAYALVKSVYDENLARIQQQDFECKFADAALRMGNLCRDGASPEDPAYYYMLADFAIRKRMQFEHYGDAKVFSGIQAALAKCREQQPPLDQPNIVSDTFPRGVAALFEKHACQVKIKGLKNGLKITIARLKNPDEYKDSCAFDCYPEYDYCNLVNEITFTATGEFIPELGDDLKFIADEVLSQVQDGKRYFGFFHHRQPIFIFRADTFKQRIPRSGKQDSEEIPFVSVVFQPNGSAYDYICEIPDVKVGDHVIVQGYGKEQEVEVTRVFSMSLNDMPLDNSAYKKVLRKV